MGSQNQYNYRGEYIGWKDDRGGIHTVDNNYISPSAHTDAGYHYIPNNNYSSNYSSSYNPPDAVQSNPWISPQEELHMKQMEAYYIEQRRWEDAAFMAEQDRGAYSLQQQMRENAEYSGMLGSDNDGYFNYNSSYYPSQKEPIKRKKTQEEMINDDIRRVGRENLIPKEEQSYVLGMFHSYAQIAELKEKADIIDLLRFKKLNKHYLWHFFAYTPEQLEEKIKEGQVNNLKGILKTVNGFSNNEINLKGLLFLKVDEDTKFSNWYDKSYSKIESENRNTITSHTEDYGYTYSYLEKMLYEYVNKNCSSTIKQLSEDNFFLDENSKLNLYGLNVIKSFTEENLKKYYNLTHSELQARIDNYVSSKRKIFELKKKFSLPFYNGFDTSSFKNFCDLKMLDKYKEFMSLDDKTLKHYFSIDRIQVRLNYFNMQSMKQEEEKRKMDELSNKSKDEILKYIEYARLEINELGELNERGLNYIKYLNPRLLKKFFNMTHGELAAKISNYDKEYLALKKKTEDFINDIETNPRYKNEYGTINLKGLMMLKSLNEVVLKKYFGIYHYHLNKRIKQYPKYIKKNSRIITKIEEKRRYKGIRGGVNRQGLEMLRKIDDSILISYFNLDRTKLEEQISRARCYRNYSYQYNK